MTTIKSRINKFRNLRRFLLAWDDEEARMNHGRLTPARTEGGSINRSGQPGDINGVGLTRWHPQFYEVIEPGIAPLVRTAVNDFDWITYSSCEGHENPGDGLPPLERHFGLLPRDDEETARMRRVLPAVIENTHRVHPPDAVELFMLDYELVGEDLVCTAIDLWFLRVKGVDWSTYFEQLPRATEEALRQFLLQLQ